MKISVKYINTKVEALTINNAITGVTEVIFY